MFFRERQTDSRRSVLDEIYARFEPNLQLLSSIALRVGILSVQLLLTTAIIVSLSIVIYVLLYNYLVPKPLTREKVFFNFELEKPRAYINLLSTERQWSYLDAQLPLEGASLRPWIDNRFLQSGMRYNFDVKVTLAKSVRNLELGKTVLTLNVVDATHTAIARSHRPIIVPFQSTVSLHLESLLLFPVRFLGLVHSPESTTVYINLMDNFLEPPLSKPPTEGIELGLSNADMDLLELEVSVVPQVHGLTFYMYYHPRLSFLVAVAALSGVQFTVLAVFILATLLTRVAQGDTARRPRRRRVVSSGPTSPFSEGEEEEEEEEEEELETAETWQDREAADRPPSPPISSTPLVLLPDQPRTDWLQPEALPATAILRQRRTSRVQVVVDLAARGSRPGDAAASHLESKID